MTRRRLASEAGFTLVELMVTMVAGVVVLLALGTILDVALRETTRSFTLVDATERARPIFEGIENQLHSGCFASEETPIQAGAGPNALIFMDATGNSSTPTAMWNEIDYNPAPTSTLTESTYTTTYSVVSGQPTWARGSLVSSKVLLTNVAPSGSTPVFQYFAYQTAPGTDAAGNQYEILPDGTSPIPGTSTTVFNPLAPGAALSSAQAATAAEVMINLTVGPAGHAHENTNLASTGQSVSDIVTFRFTPAANHDGDNATFTPCN